MGQVYTNCNLLIVRREPGGTEVSHSYVSSLKYAGFSQLERGLRTALNPIYW